jgi:hypothetical protein
MNHDLLKFLFEDSQEEDRLESLVQEMAGVERLEVKKQPLASALKSLGVAGEVELAPDCCELVYDDYEAFASDLGVLTSPDGINALAELGWVVANGGNDNGPGTMELPVYRIKFFEVNCPEPSDGKGDEDLEKVQQHLQTKGLEGANNELMGESELPDPAVYEEKKDDEKEEKKGAADWPDVPGRTSKKVKADTLPKTPSSEVKQKSFGVNLPK